MINGVSVPYFLEEDPETCCQICEPQPDTNLSEQLSVAISDKLSPNSPERRLSGPIHRTTQNYGKTRRTKLRVSVLNIHLHMLKR